MGHAGTLDPLAEGVLVVGVGPAVRLVPYVQQQPKHYVATFRLGESSVSGDLEGEVNQHADVRIPTLGQLESAAASLVGRIEQTPPAHSAIWVNGRRAYQRILAGEAFEMPKRIVQVDRLTVTRYAYPEIDLDIVCGSGTYIRSLGIDLAVAAGSVSVMAFLSRVEVGPFRLEDSLSIDCLREGDWMSSLLPAASAVSQLPQVRVNANDSVRIGHGLCIDLPSQQVSEAPRSAVEVLDPGSEALESDPREIAAMEEDGQLRAILHRKRGQWCPYRVFPTS